MISITKQKMSQRIDQTFKKLKSQNKMFQPNSIRSLLKKRNLSKLSQNDNAVQQKEKLSKTCANFNTLSKNTSDPDLESVIEAKLMIKQIDYQVSNIRTWRQHQNQLLQQKLKSNQQFFNLSKQEYEKNIKQQLSQELYENKKLIEKMKIQQIALKKNRDSRLNGSSENSNSQTLQSSQGGDICDWQSNLYDPELMANITSADDRINEKKYMKIEGNQGIQDRHQAFLNSVNQLSSSDIFNKKSIYDQANQQKTQNEQKSVDKDQLRKQLDDIQRELRQMEQLMKD